MYLLGYDIGSSSVKTALVDAQTQQVVDIVQFPEQEMEMLSRKKGWAEQQPELWWRYLCLGTKKIIEDNTIDPSTIQSIGISYQMHGLVVVNENQQVLRPAIIWCDSRAVSIGDRAFKHLSEAFCLEHYQNSPGNFTASKLKWVKDNEPDIYKKIHKIMLPGDYIAMRLTGKISTTISGLSEGILWNFKEKKLATKVLDYYGIAPDLIPEVLPTFSVTGTLSAEASKETGLAIGTSIAYRAGDQPNNALSLNVLRPGEIAATSGTSGVVYGVVDKTVVDEHSRINAFAHVNYSKKKTRIGVLLCINGAGIQYSWLRKQIARPNRSYDDMERMLSSVPVGSEGVLIFPFGNGAERIFRNINLESHIRNIEFNRHGRAHIYRAALEGVAFTFVYGINILQEMGMEISKMRVGNDNMFQSEVFATTIATLLNIEIEVVDTTGAVGAALAAGYGCGRYTSIERVMAKIKPIKRYQPAPDKAAYLQAYRYWTDHLEELLASKQRGQANEEESLALQEKNEIIAKQYMLLAEQQRKLDEMRIHLASLNGNYQNIEVRKMLNKLERNADEFEQITSHMNLLSEPFIRNLNALFPDLSFEELKMCKYLRLKFTTKEIAEKLNLSYRGAETKRYRLRKKLSVAKGKSLFSFLDAITDGD
ncbi:MAG: FGGY family carbohydrate kinase [Bacteroidota bacterium]